MKIRYTGLRHGEKLHEVLFSTLEKGRPSDHPLISQVAVPVFEPVDLPFRNEDAALRLLADQSRAEVAEVVAERVSPVMAEVSSPSGQGNTGVIR